MIKILLSYLVPLSMLLMSGYSQLAAPSDQDVTFDALVDNFDESTPIHFGSAHPDLASSLYSSSADAERSVAVEVAEIVEEKEENESDLFKKYVAHCDHATSLFNAHRADYFGHFTKKRLSSYKHFSHYASLASRHLLFRVFRI